MECSSGHIIREVDKFCSTCGEKVTVDHQIRCFRGHLCAADDAYCGTCGIALRVTDTEKADSLTVAQQPNEVMKANIEDVKKASPQENPNSWIIWVRALLVLAILGLGIGAIATMNKPLVAPTYSDSVDVCGTGWNYFTGTSEFVVQGSYNPCPPVVSGQYHLALLLSIFVVVSFFVLLTTFFARRSSRRKA